MSSSVLEKFIILFESDASEVKKGMDQADKSADALLSKSKEVDAALAGMGSKFAELASKFLGIASIGAGLYAVADGVRDLASETYNLDVAAAKFNTTADAIDELGDTAELLGLSNDAVEESLSGISRAAEDAAMGVGKAKKVFDSLKISVKDANGETRSITDIMGDLQSKMQGMDKGRQIRIMEKLGLNPALLKVFNADMDKMRDRFAQIDRATGFSLDEARKKSQDFTKAQKELGFEINSLVMLADKMRARFSLDIMEYFTAGMKIAAEWANKLFNFITEHRQLVEGVFIAIASAITYFLIPAAISGAAAVWAMIAPFAAVGAAIIGLVAAFALVYDDVQNFLAGNDSVIGELSKKWPEVGAAVLTLVDVLKLVKQGFFELGKFIVDFVKDPQKAIDDFCLTMGYAFDQSIESIKGAFSAMGDYIKGVIQPLIDWVGQKIDWIVSKAQAVKGALGMGDEGSAYQGPATPYNPSVMEEPPTDRMEQPTPAPAPAPTPAPTPAPALPRNQAPTLVQVTIPEVAYPPVLAAPLMISQQRQQITEPKRTPEADTSITAARRHLDIAKSSPLASMSSSAISNQQTTTNNRTTEVRVDKIEVSTQATDSASIASTFATEFQRQMSQTINNWDDGVSH